MLIVSQNFDIKVIYEMKKSHNYKIKVKIIKYKEINDKNKLLLIKTNYECQFQLFMS